MPKQSVAISRSAWSLSDSRRESGVRIDRIRLKNFDGITEAEVKFAPAGATIVHTPNEAGQLTLMHAINVLSG